MKAYQAYSFAVYDTLLYLNAYPDCKEALDSYNKYQKLAVKAKQDYEARFGSITPPIEAQSWEWACGAWPWQIEGGK